MLEVRSADGKTRTAAMVMVREGASVVDSRLAPHAHESSATAMVVEAPARQVGSECAFLSTLGAT